VDDRTDSGSVTRLGPDSGGRAPTDPDVRVYSWEWSTGRWDAGQERRPNLPWIGIFLLVFGGLLLLQQLYPQFDQIGSVLMLAIGLAFLINWAVKRGTGSLYAGAIITALAVPNALENVGISQDGIGQLCLGVAFLFIAAVRLSGGGGIGWQAWFGGLLALLGVVNLVQPEFGGLLVPLVLVLLGALLVFGGMFRPQSRSPGPPR
jgi:hypothetical protein